HLSGSGAVDLRVLLERESFGRLSGLGAAARRVSEAENADLQRLSRSGRRHVRRHEPATVLLKVRLKPDATSLENPDTTSYRPPSSTRPRLPRGRSCLPADSLSST